MFQRIFVYVPSVSRTKCAKRRLVSTCMGMQVAQSSNLQHQVYCNLRDSAGWVIILRCNYRVALRAPVCEASPIQVDGKISTQPTESNNLQHTWCCKLLDSATCIPMQLAGFRLTHLYNVDPRRRLTSVCLGHLLEKHCYSIRKDLEISTMTCKIPSIKFHIDPKIAKQSESIRPSQNIQFSECF